MKRIAVALLFFCLLSIITLAAFAEEAAVRSDTAVLSVTVPSSHTLIVTASDGTEVLLDGNSGGNIYR